MSGDARPPLGGSRFSQEQLRQQQRELAQRALDAQELRRLMDRNSSEARTLNDIIQELERLRNDRRYDSPEGIASLKQAIDMLHQVEIDLSRELAQVTQNDKYLYAEDSEVPSSYKKLVEEYYKALAKGKR